MHTASPNSNTHANLIPIPNGITKRRKGLHRTAKDPRKTANDLIGPLLFVYFLFGYQER